MLPLKPHVVFAVCIAAFCLSAAAAVSVCGADGAAVCADAATCCPVQMSVAGDVDWGCCALENAVCCDGGAGCCPEGTECRADGTCISVDQGKVTCPDGSVCPRDQTCCRQRAGYGCCEYTRASCCPDGMHCCPFGTTCDPDTSVCKQSGPPGAPRRLPSILPLAEVRAVFLPPSRTTTLQQTLVTEAAAPASPSSPSSSSPRCADGAMCATDETCCPVLHHQEACCLWPDAVCCDDMQHCCPHGFKCDLKHDQCVKHGKQRLGSESLPDRIPFHSLAR